MTFRPIIELKITLRDDVYTGDRWVAQKISARGMEASQASHQLSGSGAGSALLKPS